MAHATTSYDLEAVIAASTSSYREYRLQSVLPKIPRTAYEKAANGIVQTGIMPVKGYTAQIGWGVGVIPVNIRHLFSSINEEEKHVSLTAVSHTEIVEGSPCADGRKVLMVLPLPVISDRWWITNQYTNLQIRQQSNGRVAELVWKEVTDWTMTGGRKEKLQDAVQVKFTRGSWLLIALDENHTLAEYHSWVDPGGFIPAGPASSFATGSIADTFRQMEHYAKSQTVSMCDSIWQAQ